jgi:hypothetical protein
MLNLSHVHSQIKIFRASFNDEAKFVTSQMDRKHDTISLIYQIILIKK